MINKYYFTKIRHLFRLNCENRCEQNFGTQIHLGIFLESIHPPQRGK